MTKDILLSVKGLHNQGMEAAGDIETITPAQYFDKGDSSYVLYEEMVEGMETPIKNIVKFKDGYLEVTKKGPLNAHLLFETGKKNLTNYSTPFGSFTIGVDTNLVEIKEEENKIEILVRYVLEANYEYLSDCVLTMKLESK